MNRVPRLPSVILTLLLVAAMISVSGCEGETITIERTKDGAVVRSNGEVITASQDGDTPEVQSLSSDGSPSQPAGVLEAGKEGGTAASGPVSSPTPRPEFPDEAVDGDYDYDDDGLIEIRTLAQLDAMRLDPEGTGFVQEGRDQYFAAFPGTGGPSGCPNQICTGYELANDLDFDTNGNGEADAGDEYWNDGAGWKPLPKVPEGGTFDGNGYAIMNLFINRKDEKSLGLFVHNQGEILNLILEAVEVRGGHTVGGLVAGNGGAIRQCAVTGNVSETFEKYGDDRKVGGLAASNSGRTSAIGSSYFSGNVSGGGKVGGLVGLNQGSIEDSTTAGTVTGFQGIIGALSNDFEPGYRYTVGGLVGLNADVGSITSSTSLSDVSGRSLVGGLIGTNGGRVIDSKAKGNVSGVGEVGGVAGWNGGNITGSSAGGAVTGRIEVGGIVGSDREGYISTSMASGEVSGYRYVGGLIGKSDQGVVSDSTADGDVAGGEHVGGLIGYGNGTTVGQSTASGQVRGVFNVGGLVGHLESFSQRGTITGGATSSRVFGDENVGGLVGYNQGSISESNSTAEVAGVTYWGQLVGVNDGGDIETSEGSGTVSLNENPPSRHDREVLDSIAEMGLTSRSPHVLWDENGKAVFLILDLYLGGDQLKPIPLEVGSLTGLKWLSISIDGPILLSPGIGNLANLEAFSLSTTEKIPPELGNLGNLTLLDLDLKSRQATEIPPELGNLVNLEYLSISSVHYAGPMIGPIPPELGKLGNLESLYLGGRGLTGPIPPELGNLANLRELTIEARRWNDDNQKGLTGCVPTELQEQGTRLDLVRITFNGSWDSERITGLCFTE